MFWGETRLRCRGMKRRPAAPGGCGVVPQRTEILSVSLPILRLNYRIRGESRIPSRAWCSSRPADPKRPPLPPAFTRGEGKGTQLSSHSNQSVPRISVSDMMDGSASWFREPFGQVLSVVSISSLSSSHHQGSALPLAPFPNVPKERSCTDLHPHLLLNYKARFSISP